MTELANGTWVLVVEDDVDLRAALVDVLGENDVEARVAGDGCEALWMLMEGARPGLILLDLHMPFMSGWEFRQFQQRDPALAKIPVVIVSGAEANRRVDPLDAVEILHKPLGLVALGRLHHLLAHHGLPPTVAPD